MQALEFAVSISVSVQVRIAGSVDGRHKPLPGHPKPAQTQAIAAISLGPCVVPSARAAAATALVIPIAR